jgi:predicted Zn-dependent protease
VAAEPVGPCRLTGTVADLLAAVAAVGDRVRPAGAGWCAKGGQKLPVWATAPSLLLENVEVTP